MLRASSFLVYPLFKDHANISSDQLHFEIQFNIMTVIVVPRDMYYFSRNAPKRMSRPIFQQKIVYEPFLEMVSPYEPIALEIPIMHPRFIPWNNSV